MLSSSPSCAAIQIDQPSVLVCIYIYLYIYTHMQQEKIYTANATLGRACFVNVCLHITFKYQLLFVIRLCSHFYPWIKQLPFFSECKSRNDPVSEKTSSGQFLQEHNSNSHLSSQMIRSQSSFLINILTYTLCSFQPYLCLFFNFFLCQKCSS